MKKYNLSKVKKSDIDFEIYVTKDLSHPNMISLFEYYVDEYNTYLITEYCQGGLLFDYILMHRGLQEEDAVFIISQLLSVINYLHSQNVILKNLKPDSIMLQHKSRYIHQVNIQIIDFGMCGEFQTNPFAFMSGEKLDSNENLTYLAPEVIKRGHYSKKSDIYSVGIILYAMLVGKPPFINNDQNQLRETIINDDINFNEDWGHISTSCINFVSKMLSKDPSQRFTASQALIDPWITKHKKCFKYTKHQSQNAQKIIKRLTEFNNNSEIKNGLLHFILIQSNITEIHDLQEFFQKIDENGDGVITREELLKGVKMIGYDQFEDVEKEVTNIMKSVDHDNNGFIDYNEFIMCAIDKKILLGEQQLKNIFKKIDIDGNGKIDFKEFSSLVFKNAQISAQQWAEITKKIDFNSDGELDFDEFKFILTQL